MGIARNRGGLLGLALALLALAQAPGTAAAEAGSGPELPHERPVDGPAGPPAEPSARLSLVEATSQALLRQGDVDFGLAFDIDLPVEAVKLGLETALGGTEAETGRYAVVFDVALAKASRKVRDVRPATGRRVVEVKRTPSPDYQRAQQRLKKAEQDVRRPSIGSLVAFGPLAYLFHDSDPRKAEEARQRLLETPEFIEKPVLGDYKYRVADVEARKVLTVNYTVIDKRERRWWRSVFDTVENQRFTVAYDLDPGDPELERHRVDHGSERAVADWERAPVVVSLARIIASYEENRAQARPLGDPQALLSEILASRNAALARASAERFDDRPLNDPRFDSVVAIYRGDGAMGSGFYVRPSLVMTNWHVVENNPLVEIKRFDRQETFGQVIAKDVRLDLALVKVQDRGRPVDFLRGGEVRPGDTVEVIGHPQGYLFSITRGAVSAIRRQSAVTIPGGDKVLFIQTDAAINHGNSGGPLFLGDKVAGVSAWGPSSPEGGQTPGLNFSIHYAEAVRFLDDALKGE